MKKLSRGLFIALEGLEKTGKTTTINRLFNWLINEGYDVVKTKEPGGTELGNEIRNILLNKTYMRDIEVKGWSLEGKMYMTPKTEALLYAASRQQHVDEFILPNEKEKRIILCDRYMHTSLVYQGIVRHLGLPYVFKINPDVFPDMTFVLNGDVEKIMSRGEREEDNRYEKEEGLTFHKKASEGYDILVNHFHDNIPTIPIMKNAEGITITIKNVDELKVNDYVTRMGSYYVSYNVIFNDKIILVRNNIVRKIINKEELRRDHLVNGTFDLNNNRRMSSKEFRHIKY